MEMQPTKKATRDYRSYSDTPWGIWDVMYARRSNRKYLPAGMSDEMARSLGETVELVGEVRGAAPGSIIPVTDQAKADMVRRRSIKGARNKINLWMARSPVSGFLVISVPADDVGAERPSELPRAVMAVEDCVLWLTAAGMGTCWLAGVNEREVRGVLDLDSGNAVPAIIYIGKPKPVSRSVSYDALTARTMSRRRKPLSDIASVETADRRYSVDRIPREPFSACPEQDIGGLLQRVRLGCGGSGDAPLGLLVDACLEAARIAPNGGNAQRWRFIVVRDGDSLDELSSACGGVTGERWRAAIVAAGGVKRPETLVFDKPFWMIDVPIALSHMSLMAASMGCGADVRAGDIGEGAISRLVRLPSGMRTAGVMGIC